MIARVRREKAVFLVQNLDRERMYLEGRRTKVQGIKALMVGQRQEGAGCSRMQGLEGGMGEGEYSPAKGLNLCLRTLVS